MPKTAVAESAMVGFLAEPWIRQVLLLWKFQVSTLRLQLHPKQYL